MQALHVPPPQTWLEPQVVPLGTAAPVSVQIGLPLPQAIAPTWHGFAGAQACPVLHAVHVPPPQTWPEPQLVPFGTAASVSVQIGLPLPQAIAPVWHGFAGEQACPVLHAVHAPPPQTWPEPQLVPFGTAPPVSVQTGLPLPQAIAPT